MVHVSDRSRIALANVGAVPEVSEVSEAYLVIYNNICPLIWTSSMSYNIAYYVYQLSHSMGPQCTGMICQLRCYIFMVTLTVVPEGKVSINNIIIPCMVT